ADAFAPRRAGVLHHHRHAGHRHRRDPRGAVDRAVLPPRRPHEGRARRPGRPRRGSDPVAAGLRRAGATLAWAVPAALAWAVPPTPGAGGLDDTADATRGRLPYGGTMTNRSEALPAGEGRPSRP